MVELRLRHSYMVGAWKDMVRKCELRKIQPPVAFLRLLPELQRTCNQQTGLHSMALKGACADEAGM